MKAADVETRARRNDTGVGRPIDDPNDIRVNARKTHAAPER